MFELRVEMPFSAAHRICGHGGSCANLHGHNYRALITVEGDQLNHLGMLIDFGELKQVCGEVVDPLDHSFLNELPAFQQVNPTAEAIAREVYVGVASRLAGRYEGLRVAEVTVFESDRSSATYRE